MKPLDEIVEEARSTFAATTSLPALDQAKARFLGKSGLITELMKGLGGMSPEARKEAGARINQAKAQVEELLRMRREAIQAEALAAQLRQEALDVTLPGRGPGVGGLHPVTRCLQRIERLFASIGFDVAEGPEIETDFYNFTALNIPEDHPARAMHDTFYLPDGRLLRTHTSPVQLRAMREHRPPLRVIAAGKVYRSDSDQTHSPMFHQVEGLVVDEGVSFAQLKGTLSDFVAAFFERGFRMRFRPSYFPFTEPSAEVDLLWEPGDGSAPRWLEVLGCGMVHPRVLKNGGIDPERYTGFAFGLGVERFAMLRYGVSDLRAFFDNDLRFLAPFV